ncbi:SseB family protein [Butyrivibrio sp. CB08]|uniref:SseB family protein n=1 Tax=Butyrivibrio sp. CB08 TaxID=2364879 RepID=UPI000EA8EF96|nr:SseB family protein [Butyrivibrio sp. CB08]RKM60471.1 SseB family protein [Butyrivibrio sp. CB08]
MGLFDIFGGKKNEALAEQEREQALAAQKEQALEEVKAAHEGLEWPVIGRLNPVNIKGAEDSVMKETVSEDRKDAVGEMIYEEEISPDSLKFLSSQELLFLLTALEKFHKHSPLPGFEANHRKVYNVVLDRIRDAEYLYVLYDLATGYPFIDHGFGCIYFEKELAEEAAALFAKQYRKLAVKECLVEDKQNHNKVGFFDFLYYIGIENLIIDNGAYRARFKRNEIVAAPGDWGGDKKMMPSNPALNFAMMDCLAERKWPVNYEKRDEVIKAKEMRMFTLMRNGRFILPMKHEGPAEVMEDGRIKIGKDSKIEFLILKTPDGKQFLPVYTDGFEFAKVNKGKEWNAGVFRFQDLIRFVGDRDGVTFNPDGHRIIMNKQQLMVIEAAAQQADALKAKKS